MGVIVANELTEISLRNAISCLEESQGTKEALEMLDKGAVGIHAIHRQTLRNHLVIMRQQRQILYNQEQMTRLLNQIVSKR